MGIDMSNVLIVTLDRDKVSPSGEQEGKIFDMYQLLLSVRIIKK
jgi:hypothetical protein